MLDPAIRSFLNERKEMWLKKKINTRTTDKEKYELEQEADQQFSLARWLPNAAKRARQLSMVSHPGKFSHPSAKTSSIIAQAEYAADGYLRTGNVAVELDVLGNAAAMDVYKFLVLELQDGKSLLQHLEQASDEIQQQLKIPEHSFESIANQLLMIKQNNSTTQTSERVKQVYFPINEAQNDYHLLSLLTSSGMIFELKKRIRNLRFSETAQQAFEAKKSSSSNEHGYAEVPNLTAIGFGGTKPQNISVLNSQNGGTAHLLPSVPPTLNKNRIPTPRKNFFTSLRLKQYQKDFQKLHNLLISPENNRHIRRKTQGIMKTIIYGVIDQSWRIRYLDAGWSQAERCDNLPKYQKLWLDQHYRDSEEKANSDSWLEQVSEEIARWFLRSYKKLLKDQALDFTDSQLVQIKNIISECKEALK